MFVSEQLKPHSSDIRSLFYDTEDNKLYSSSPDGQLLQYDDQYKPNQIAELAPIAVSTISEGKVYLSTVTGVSIVISTEDAKQLPMKTHSRPKSIVIYNGVPVVSDMQGYLYYDNQEFMFSKFEYDNRLVDNGANQLSIFGNTLAVALSSGHIALFDMQKPLSSGPEIAPKVHDHPARCVQLISDDAFVSGGNDGNVFLSVRRNGQCSSVLISPRYCQSDYVLDISYANGLLSICGTGLFGYVLRVPEPQRLISACSDENVASEISLLAVVPLPSDCWVTQVTCDGVVFGCEYGSLVVLSPQETGFHREYIEEYSEQVIPEAKFANAQAFLMTRRLYEEFDYDEFELISEIAPASPVFLCVIGGKVSLIANCSGTYQRMGVVDLQARKKVRDDKGLEWDYRYQIDAEMAPGQKLYLYMNASEDSYTAGMRFLTESGLVANSQVDRTDQIAQIRDFIDKNAPKEGIYDFLYPDNDVFFLFTMKQSPDNLHLCNSTQREQKLLDFSLIQTSPVEMVPQYVEKAYSHISEYFENTKMEECFNLITGDLVELNEFCEIGERQLSAFCCVCSYGIETQQLAKELFDVNFINKLFEIFMQSQVRSVTVMSGRLLGYISQKCIFSELNMKADMFFNKCEELDENDGIALVCRVGNCIGETDPNSILLQQLLANLIKQK